MPDGFTYEGEWQNGEISGRGVATYSNGDIYEGMFLRGKRQGEGTMRYATGEEATGEWSNGALESQTSTGTAGTDDNAQTQDDTQTAD
jgi:hypothetical protein